MSKPPLLFRVLLLAWTLAFTPTSFSENDDPAQSLTTVALRREALAELLTERAQLESSGSKAELVRVNNQIVKLHLLSWDLDSAAAESQHSLSLAEQLGANDGPLLVDTLVLAARPLIRLYQLDNALALLNRALALSQTLQYRAGEAQAFAQLGSAYYELDDRAKAVEMHKAALAIWRDLPNKPAEARTLTLQGEILMVDERTDEAIATFREAESICRSLNHNTCLATVLIDFAYLAIRQGQWQTALNYLNQVESLHIEKEAEPNLAGQTAMGFGLVYESYGQLEPARSYFEQSFMSYRDGAHDRRAAVDAGTRVARVRAAQGDYTEAKAQIEQLLTDGSLKITNNLSIGLFHEDLGRIWLEAGSYESARSEFLLAIDYFTKSKTARPLARAQMFLARTEQLLGNLAQSAAAYNRALPYFENNIDYTNEAVLRAGMGKLALQQGQLDVAEKNLQRSITLTEQLRENAWSRDLRSSFLASVHDRYQSYVELLMTRNAIKTDRQLEIRAFEISETGRARALIDSLHDLRELRQPSEPALLKEEADSQVKEQELIDKRAKLMSESGSEEEIAAVDKDLTEIRSRYEALEARINTNARFNYLLRPTPLSFEEIKNELTDDHTALLSYSLGTNKSFAWLITKDGLRSYELANEQTIDEAARRLIRLLQSPPADTAEEDRLQKTIDEVSSLVVKPIADQLQTSRLIIIADGVLQYVPFQLLKTSPDAKDPLIANFDIVEAPSASVLALVRREQAHPKPSKKLLVGFGDAVFSPEYLPPGRSGPAVTRSAAANSENMSKLSKLPRLFNAKRELSNISDLAGSDSAFFVEYNATRDNLLGVGVDQYRILHVVTHGVLDALKPERSGLVLSLIDENQKPIAGFVSLADIYRLRAPDLVVLSACSTALGQRQDGEGLIGVMRGFMYAGASGVVASLWRVDDHASAELMKHFYVNMLQRGMGPAAALRDAQNQIRSRPEWSSPYYWAGFTFQGNYDLQIKAVPPTRVGRYQMLIAGGPFILLLLAVGYWYLRRRKAGMTR